MSEPEPSRDALSASQRPLGFVILTHASPGQLQRLITGLNRQYDHPPIACHHDFNQSDLDPRVFPTNVRFVRPSLKTGWGKWAVVEAFLAALALLYSDGGPKWFTLLSGADYPVRLGRLVLAELAEARCDAFLDTHEMGKGATAAHLTGEWNVSLAHLQTEESRRTKWLFYLSWQFWIPMLRRKPRWRLGRFTIRPPFVARRFFGPDFRLFWGDHWFTGNRRIAGILLNPTAVHLRLRRYLKWRTSPDECYYQTVLCNTPGLTICRDNRRFAEWNGGGAHPQTLTAADVASATGSGNHFARKFAPGSSALDAIDAALAADEADGRRDGAGTAVV